VALHINKIINMKERPAPAKIKVNVNKYKYICMHNRIFVYKNMYRRDLLVMCRYDACTYFCSRSAALEVSRDHPLAIASPGGGPPAED